MDERLEDAFTDVVKKFATTPDFVTFAQSGNGLSLSVQDVTTILENHRFSVEEQKKKILWLWVEKNGANATPQGIRNLVTQYYAAGCQPVAAPVERIEDVFQHINQRFTSEQFKQFARSGQGLSLTEHEVDTITENNRFSVEERNLKLLWKWRHSRYPNTDVAAVIERIRAVVGLYVQDANEVEEEQIFQEPNQAENEQSRLAVRSTLEISKSLKKPTPPGTSAKAMGNTKNNQEYLGIMKNYVEQMWESAKDLLVKRPEPAGVSEAKEFLEVVENCMKQMLESKLKSVKEKTKMEDFILPKVTEFRESDKQISLQSVDFTKIHSLNSVNHVMLLGDTGSGKTTFSMRYAMLALEKKLDFSGEIKMIYFVDASKLQCGYSTIAFDLLFIQQLGLKLPKHLHKVGQEWFEQNSKHILLVVDGLDQIKKPFENKYPRIGPETLSETNTIIANILSDHLYPGMKILSTSRWNIFWKLPPDLKATLNLTLGGWNDETLNRLAERLFTPGSKEAFDALRPKAPGLVSNPMFFFYLVLVLKDSNERNVETITNLMVSVLICFSGSRHGETVKSVQKLMKLAFRGMKDNLFVFTASYVESLKLDMKEMRGLVEMDADTRFVEDVADDVYMKIRFSHQSIQEILASLFACTLDLDEFKKFIEDNYEKSEMEVVIKHIFGIILNKSTSEKAAKYIPDNLHTKSEYLMSYLDKLLEGEVILDERLVPLLHECGSVVIKEVCSQIKVMDFRFSQAIEQHTILPVVENIGSLRTLNLIDLALHLDKYSSLQHVFGSVQNIHVVFFFLYNCEPDAEKLRILYEAMALINFKIELGLFIMESPALEPVGYYYLIRLVHHGGTGWLSLNDCDLNAEKISKMNEAAVDYGVKLNLLNISENPNMDAEAYQQLAKLLRNTEVKDLSANYCTPTSEQLSALCTSLENENVKLLNLWLARSTTESPTDDDELLTVSRLVQRVKKFRFSFENLNASQIEDLAEKTHKLRPKVEVKCESLECCIRTATDDNFFNDMLIELLRKMP